MTEFVQFVFSGAGALCLATGVLLWLRMRERRNAVLRVAAPIAVLYALTAVYPIPHGISRWLMRAQRPFAPSDIGPGHIALAVLGAGSQVAEDSDGVRILLPNETSMSRVLEAARVYRLVRPDWVIASGGRVYEDDPSSSSAEGAQRLLTELGVPLSRIVIDTTPKTTHEESVVVSAIVRRLNVDRLVVVTSDLHMPRALGAFRSQGIDAVPAVARRPYNRPPWGLALLPSDIGMDEAAAVTRELLGIAYYSVRGWYRAG